LAADLVSNSAAILVLACSAFKGLPVMPAPAGAEGRRQVMRTALFVAWNGSGDVL
jgi:hypothetical protein